MQSASTDTGLRVSGELLWRRARRSVDGGRFWLAVVVLVLTLTIANSTVTADWVDGIGVIPDVAVGAAIFMAILALTRLPSAVVLTIGTFVAPVVAVVAAAPVIRANHPLDQTGVGLIGVWSTRIANGQAAADPSFYLVLICLLMFVTGAWLSWCVLRWRKPLLGLIPGAAAFATNVLNFPTDQNGYTLGVLFLTLVLLLWSTYSGSIATAAQARVKLNGNVHLDFWESGLAAMAGLIVLSVLLPPLSTSDRTTQIESSLFTGWAQLQQRLNHPGLVGGGPGGSGSTGFSSNVGLGTSLTRTRDVIFEYTYTGTYPGARYFRGLDVNILSQGQWQYPLGGPGLVQDITKNQLPVYAENYDKLAVNSFTIDMIKPPADFPDLIFYPGLLRRVNKQTVATEAPLPPETPSLGLNSIDRLSAVKPASAAGTYTVDVEVSTATSAQLQASGTAYPKWVEPFSTLPSEGYRSPDVLQRIHALALRIVTQANATNPYDQASAIEAYLRGSTFRYTLNPPAPPQGTDPLAYFLFDSHAGYCEYFATAMGDMLRSLGVPTRLVNGFGPGQFEVSVGRYVVRGEDAHTWVESYFPGYGWIPFEPTNDNVYNVITRGASGVNTCLRDNGCDVLPGATGSVPGITLPNVGRRGGIQDAAGGTTTGLTLQAPDAGTVTKIVAILLAILLLLMAGMTRYLRPRTVTAVWNRTLTLARLAGADHGLGETPLEFGRRLQAAFPEGTDAARALTQGFVVAAYAPPDVASSSRSAVMDAWTELRPVLLRRVVARVRRTPGRNL
jgi:Transglutaminase-like superfamily/Domain of unknown function (DUF4129)